MKGHCENEEVFYGFYLNVHFGVRLTVSILSCSWCNENFIISKDSWARTLLSSLRYFFVLFCFFNTKETYKRFGGKKYVTHHNKNIPQIFLTCVWKNTERARDMHWERQRCKERNFIKSSYTPVPISHGIPYFVDVIRIRPSKTGHKWTFGNNFYGPFLMLRVKLVEAIMELEVLLSPLTCRSMGNSPNFSIKLIPFFK